MKLSMWAVLVLIAGLPGPAHAGCAASTCAAENQEKAAEFTLQKRIDNALKDLEIYNAQAFKPDNLKETESKLTRMIENALQDLDSATQRNLKADPERLNELLRRSGIDRR
jgi:hypothetical protein